MFSGFNLKIDKNFFGLDFQKYKEIGESHLYKKKSDCESDMLKYVTGDTLNGNKIQEDWFAEIEADVFISHSHKDRDLANAFAGWLNDTFKLKVFIDSNVWGFSKNLLDMINYQYSDRQEYSNKNVLYNYQKCNTASQHVYMMLTVALQKMIDKVECVILLNTSNSISVFNEFQDGFNNTYSPWIYFEIISSQLVRKKPLLFFRKYETLIHANESANLMYALESLTISYNISLNHLIKLDEDDLEKWLSEYRPGINCYKYPLDALYSFTHPNELEETQNIFSNYDLEQIQYLKECIVGNNRNISLASESANASICELCSEHCKECRCKKCPFHLNRRILNE